MDTYHSDDEKKYDVIVGTTKSMRQIVRPVREKHVSTEGSKYQMILKEKENNNCEYNVTKIST